MGVEVNYMVPISMPTLHYTMGSQVGNSCAAHCTTIAVSEIRDSQVLDQAGTEGGLWPAIQFQTADGPPVTTLGLDGDHNSDPRRIVAQVNQRWPDIKTKLVCDRRQKATALLSIL